MYEIQSDFTNNKGISLLTAIQNLVRHKFLQQVGLLIPVILSISLHFDYKLNYNGRRAYEMRLTKKIKHDYHFKGLQKKTGS